MIWGTISPIKPKISEETARAKVKVAQDAWNTKNTRTRQHRLILPILYGVIVINF